jgi:L-alanine-DL-glutamate epimerase-like enolase superfamily enzyme
MQLSTVDAYELSSPIEPPQERRFQGGVRRLLKRDVVLVVVGTPDGEVGYATAGASSSAMREYFEGLAHEGVADLLEGPVAEALAGRELSAAADLRGVVDGLDLPPSLHSEVVSALDVAYHDLRGKRAGASVADLLADEHDAPAPTRELPLYASAGMYMEPAGYAEQAAAVADRGFAGYKFRPGIGPERDVRTLELVRERVGDGFDVMVDAHTWWKVRDGSYPPERVDDLAREFAAFDPYWLEEPVAPDDHAGYRRLADRADVPLAGGESEESPEGLLDLARTGAVSFLQGDVRHHWGCTGCWDAVAYCADGDRDVQFVPHHFGTHLGLVANAHLVAAAPGAELLEYPVFGDDVAAMYPFPLAAELLATDLDPTDGRLTLPDGPGLGVEVDLDVVERYPYVEGPWTEFRYDGASTDD